MKTSLALVGLSLMTPALPAATFGDDLAFLRQHTSLIVLRDPDAKAQVAVVPAWQGRVVTSTARGPDGTSFGWVNRGLISSGKLHPKINVFGGEDRFWLGPEGGQYSIFFKPGSKFDLEHWKTPAAIDTEPFETVSASADRAVFRRTMTLENFSGSQFHLEVTREIRLVPTQTALAELSLPSESELSGIAIETDNRVTNTGEHAWRKETGLLSIWILGMFNASASATVVVPFRTGDAATLGPIVNDAYFGKVPAERLVVKDGAIFFRGDAQHRGKIGLSPRRAKPVLGSYDADSRTLTIVSYTLPPGATDYVNSMWEHQKEPYAGDAVNSYNDGPPTPGEEQLGNFFELESSSPALALAPGESARHVHRTLHLQGEESALDPIARAAFGVGIDAIKRAFSK